MRPVFQTQLSNGNIKGDCWRACIASLLEVESADVPHFLELDSERMMENTQEWLRDNYNVGLLTVHLKPFEDTGIVYYGTPGTLCIASIPSPNIAGSHAVIARISSSGLSLQFVFDPRKGGKPCANSDMYFLDAHQPESAHFMVKL